MYIQARESLNVSCVKQKVTSLNTARLRRIINTPKEIRTTTSDDSDRSLIDPKLFPNIINDTPENDKTIEITSQSTENLQTVSQISTVKLSLSASEPPQPNAMPPPSATTKRPLSSSGSSTTSGKNNKEITKVKSEDKIMQPTKKAKKPRKNI